MEHRTREFLSLSPNVSIYLLDRYAPVDVCKAIYGGVTGAQYDPSIGQWTVPCNAEIDMALQIEYVTSPTSLSFSDDSEVIKYSPFILWMSHLQRQVTRTLV